MLGRNNKTRQYLLSSPPEHIFLFHKSCVNTPEHRTYLCMEREYYYEVCCLREEEIVLFMSPHIITFRVSPQDERYPLNTLDSGRKFPISNYKYGDGEIEFSVIFKSIGAAVREVSTATGMILFTIKRIWSFLNSRSLKLIKEQLGKILLKINIQQSLFNFRAELKEFILCISAPRSVKFGFNFCLKILILQFCSPILLRISQYCQQSGMKRFIKH